MHWAGKPSGRVGRGSNVVNLSETRWIVPTRPYQAPKGSWEYAENMILLGVGAAVIIFGFAIIIMGSVM